MINKTTNAAPLTYAQVTMHNDDRIDEHALEYNPSPSLTAVHQVLQLQAAGATDDEVLEAILEASPRQVPTVELVLDGKGELRAVPYKRILHDLENQDDEVVRAHVHAGNIRQLAKRGDGDVSVFVKADIDVVAFQSRQLTINNNKYHFKTNNPLTNKFFVDVINFTCNDNLRDLIRLLRESGFNVIAATDRLRTRVGKTSSPMIRVFTTDVKPPACAFVNGELFDQIEFNGRLLPVNCKGSRSAANTRARSQHCLDLAPMRQQQAVDTSGGDDFDMGGDDRTLVGLARAGATPADLKRLVHAREWTTVKGGPRIDASIRDSPALRIQWSSANRFAELSELDVVVDAAPYGDDDGEPAVLIYQAKALNRPNREGVVIPGCTFSASGKTGKIVQREMSLTEIDNAIKQLSHIDAAAASDAVTSSTAEIGGADSILQSATEYESVTALVQTKPIAAAGAILSYIRQHDKTLQGVTAMHLLARALAAVDVTNGRSYSKQLHLHLPGAVLSRDVATAWERSLGNDDLTRLNKGLALFELLLRVTAPQIERSDAAIMLLSGVQVHWLPSATDRYLHPATLLALAASDFGKHLIDTALRLDGGLDELALVRKCVSDEAMITMVLARPMTLAVARVDDNMSSTFVPALAQY